MCLPSIIEVAEKAELEFNPRTISKKEVYAKCPFCLYDANVKGKYKLSLNQDYNVFKCWYCDEKGGVLDFESKLTGVPYDEVKRKYFGKKKKYHQVETLSPNQLKTIGWAEYKRKNRADFYKKRDEVIQEWKCYERSEMIKYFAMLMVIAHLDDVSRQQELLEFLAESCDKSQVKELFSRVFNEYLKEANERADWTYEAINIARSAWRVSKDTFDFDFEQVLSNIVVLHYMNLYLKGNLKSS